ncbi:membrane protein insertion efficiency factor YidD [Mycobacterium sp.]|uniref:membrane protein insertion efficiency factor YidD n=1 Tax=Mycobacterium sp. TaxID=1785 RepID=UPI0025F3B12A|nr:membrane protein insertion efficiency factor YidD [Mycobacterium sp.]MBW0013232.1 membrane protein insertion efficiency factor YidD [Mycobacterium sp.]
MTASTRNVAGGVGKVTGRRLVRALVFLIQLYRHMVSPLRPATCRFIPTCSQYAVDALTEYGLIRGSWLAAARLARCGPWHRGGWDPIPDRRERRAQSDDPGRPASQARGPAAEQRKSESFV